MRFKFSIGQKLALGFGILLIAFFMSSWFTFDILKKTSKLNKGISEVTTPSISKLKDLELLIVKSTALTVTWLEDDRQIDEVEQKKELQRIYNDDYPVLKKELNRLVMSWPKEKRESIYSTISNIDSLLNLQHEIMLTFKDPNDYYTPADRVDIRYSLRDNLLTEGKDIFKFVARLKADVAEAIKEQELMANKDSNEMAILFNQLGQLIIYLGLFLIVGGLVVALFTIRAIVRPVKQLREALVIMGRGILPEKKMVVGSDEIGEMTAALNDLVDGLKSTSNFAKEIGEGNFSYDYQQLSEEDTLGNSLLLMRDNLASLAIEDRKRNWATEGIAMFAEVLRRNNDDVETLAGTLISELVKYIKANQGSVFVVDDEGEFLEMKGCYAWDRQKVFEHKIELGDGLVGQCWQEQDTLYINDIPNDYIRITSGLGQANPSCILIVPLIYNEEIFGVMELASFEEFEPYQIGFVEKIAESAASTIASVKVNEQTKELLEQSQEASEQLKTREEELRASQEKLQKAQAEMQKKLEDNEVEIVRSNRTIEKIREENQILQNVLLRKTKELEEIKEKQFLN